MSYEKQKETHGGWATVAWIGSGLYLYFTTEGASLFSWSALVFFLVGMFAAAIVFGMAGYALQKGLSKVLMLVVQTPATAVRASSFIGLLGWVLFAVETVVIFLAASWVFHQIVEPSRAAVPAEFIDDRDNFITAMTAFTDANKLDQENMAGRDSADIDPEKEKELQALIAKGLESGRKISDEFLTYLHPQLPMAYRTQLIGGHKLLLKGRVDGDVLIQGTGIELLRRFYTEFWPAHANDIIPKLE